MTPPPKFRLPALLLPALLLLSLSRCGPGELETVRTVGSGPYQIEVLSPGGAFESGENRVGIRVLRDGRPEEIQNVQLLFIMPPMGSMPPMRAEASFSSGDTGNANAAEGTVSFTMGGGWNGRVQVTTSSGPAAGDFDVQVRQ